jgi:hypothetical protein
MRVHIHYIHITRHIYIHTCYVQTIMHMCVCVCVRERERER